VISQQLNASLISSNLPNLGFGTKSNYICVCVCASQIVVLRLIYCVCCVVILSNNFLPFFDVQIDMGVN
jgi:hypothetical protein